MANAVITLPKLTPKQHAYVMARADGMGITEAYRATYSLSNPDHPNARKMAWQQETKPKITKWIEYINDGIGRAICTKEAHLHRLDVLGKEAQDKKDTGNAIRAEELRGKAVGHYNHTKHIQTQHMDLAEIMKAIDGQSRGIQTIEGECEVVE